MTKLWLYPGAPVVCVSNDFEKRPGITLPTVGATYTVRDIASARGDEYIRLNEIHNPTHIYAEGFSEVRFNVAAFRPILPDTRALVAELDAQITRFVQQEASGGMGIRRSVGA